MTCHFTYVRDNQLNNHLSIYLFDTSNLKIHTFVLSQNTILTKPIVSHRVCFADAGHESSFLNAFVKVRDKKIIENPIKYLFLFNVKEVQFPI